MAEKTTPIKPEKFVVRLKFFGLVRTTRPEDFVEKLQELCRGVHRVPQKITASVGIPTSRLNERNSPNGKI